MREFPPGQYARWRAIFAAPAGLHETASARVPSERLLQHIWRHQRLRREALRTLDGRALLVLHPGFWNREAGPDFRRAVLQFGDASPRSGDIEVDLDPTGWTQHRHRGNPAYRGVCLHVVWDAASPEPNDLPTLALKGHLDAPLAHLEDWVGGLAKASFPPGLLGACARDFSRMPVETLAGLLDQAARVRLEQKAALFEARARQAGWEQALWEGLFAALGYKNNLWPMRRLAELLPFLRPDTDAAGCARGWQARLLGISGLLPADLSRSRGGADAYVRAIWDEWWREQARCTAHVLPLAAWKLHGLRPANHPTRRLALAAHWLADPGWLGRIERWIEAPTPDRQLLPSLTGVCQVPLDDFWSWHWTLRSPRLGTAHPLLGAARVTDLAVNVVLPWFWSRAAAGRNEGVRGQVEHRYFVWPAAQSNVVLALAHQRVLAELNLPLLRRAACQQGLLQIVRDFCDRTDALCLGCPLPGLIRGCTRTE